MPLFFFKEEVRKKGYVTQRNSAHFYYSEKLTEELRFQKESTFCTEQSTEIFNHLKGQSSPYASFAIYALT